MRSLVLLLIVLVHCRVLGFVPFVRPQRAACHSTLQMAKRKLSMAEKRKRRAKKLPPRPVTGKPVNFDKFVEMEGEAQQESKQVDDSGDTPPTERAKQLLEAQRKSVDMLTHVRERVEALDYDKIKSSLDSKGYSVVDDFLQKDYIIDELRKEGLALFQKEDMEVDLTNLGSGEYVCKIEGGEEQYVICPRTVELVVSMTKHMAPAFQQNLDPSACMSTMRTYDRKAQQASLELIGKDVPKRALGIVATEEKDSRKISLFYYPNEGGGVAFENEQTIPANRDRLFLLKSDSCLHRKEPWNDKELDNASCIELHLIKG